MALRALGLEDLGALLGISFLSEDFRHFEKGVGKVWGEGKCEEKYIYICVEWIVSTTPKPTPTPGNNHSKKTATADSKKNKARKNTHANDFDKENANHKLRETGNGKREPCDDLELIISSTQDDGEACD